MNCEQVRQDNLHRLVDMTATYRQRLEDRLFEPNSLLVLISAGCGSEKWLAGTVMEMLDTYPNDTEGIHILLGLNDGHEDNYLFNELKNRTNIRTRWWTWKYDNYESHVCSWGRPHSTVDIIRQPNRGKKTGKIGMLRELAYWIDNCGEAEFSGGIPGHVLMADAESRFSSLADYEKEWQRHPNSILAARYYNVVFKMTTTQESCGWIPDSRIPISLFLTKANMKHPLEGYIGGGGYIGKTDKILPMISAIGKMLPGVHSDDSAVHKLAQSMGIPVAVSFKHNVTNNTFPPWDKRHIVQMKRWSVGTRATEGALGKVDLPVSDKRKEKYYLGLAALIMMYKSILYSRIYPPAIGAALNCLKNRHQYVDWNKLPVPDIFSSETDPSW